MSIKSTRSALKNLYKIMGKLNTAENNLYTELEEYIKLEDWSIQYQPSDGYVLEYQSYNAAIHLILLEIQKVGFIDEKNYFKCTL
jgi:hypothetical protein